MKMIVITLMLALCACTQLPPRAPVDAAPLKPEVRSPFNAVVTARNWADPAGYPEAGGTDGPQK